MLDLGVKGQLVLFLFLFFFSGQREIGFASHLAEHFTLVVWVLLGATILTNPVTQNR